VALAWSALLVNAIYDISWVGIDAGREGLWQEPIWTRVIEIISLHQGEKVYDPNSPIYASLIKEFPNEKWCSLTPEKYFRPLFRDYPNSWTRTGVISLDGRLFRLTSLGEKYLDGLIKKSDILINLFSHHAESNPVLNKIEYPFSILSNALLVTPRPLTAKEVYWVVMKNYRPGEQIFADIFSQKCKYTPKDPEPTPFRRIRHMLQLLRAADAIESYRRGNDVYWGPRDSTILNRITRLSLAK